MKRIRSLGRACFVAAIICSGAHAEDGGDFYAGLDANYLMNELESASGTKAKFGLASLGARAGVYIEPQVGLEIYGSLGVSDDEEQGISMDAVSSLGVLGRFESPDSRGGKLFILLGYGATELEMKRSASSLDDRELYHGFVYGGGAEFRLGQSNTFVSIQGMKYYNEDNLSLSGAGLGLRHQF